MRIWFQSQWLVLLWLEPDQFKPARSRQPIKWNEIEPAKFDGLILPGWHAKGMREYVESTKFQENVAEFFDLNRPFGAICHGVVLAARSKSKKCSPNPLLERRGSEKSRLFLGLWSSPIGIKGRPWRLAQGLIGRHFLSPLKVICKKTLSGCSPYSTQLNLTQFNTILIHHKWAISK